MSKKIKAVIFDWAGTAVDYGSFAPVKGFVDGFKSIGIDITVEMNALLSVIGDIDRRLAQAEPHGLPPDRK